MMVRGKEQEIRRQYEESGLTLVYSDENINEIERSVKRRDSFHDLLQRLDAKYIHVPLDEEFNHKGIISIDNKPSRIRAQEIEQARSETNNLSDGLEFLSKGYGGVVDKSFKEIMTFQINEAEKLISEAISDLNQDDPAVAEILAKVNVQRGEIAKVRKSIEHTFVELDKRPIDIPVFDQFQKELGIKSIELSNFDPENAVEEIWNLVEHKFDATDLNLVGYLDKILSFSDKGPQSRPRELQLINGIYNWLNMVGYHRDDNLADSARMQASFGDMTHAGYGAACTKFFCNDKKMRLKIAATYSYLGVRCEISTYK